jgi:hypothetical protein
MSNFEHIPHYNNLGLHAMDASTAYWLDAATMSVDARSADIPEDDMIEDVAGDLIAEIQLSQLAQIEQYYVSSLKQLFDAGEITFVGLLIRLNNLYPQEMAGLCLTLRARIQAILRNPQ